MKNEHKIALFRADFCDRQMFFKKLKKIIDVGLTSCIIGGVLSEKHPQDA
jgi:hypothetical protein